MGPKIVYQDGPKNRSLGNYPFVKTVNIDKIHNFQFRLYIFLKNSYFHPFLSKIDNFLEYISSFSQSCFYSILTLTNYFQA